MFSSWDLDLQCATCEMKATFYKRGSKFNIEISGEKFENIFIQNPFYLQSPHICIGFHKSDFIMVIVAREKRDKIHVSSIKFVSIFWLLIEKKVKILTSQTFCLWFEGVKIMNTGLLCMFYQFQFEKKGIWYSMKIHKTTVLRFVIFSIDVPFWELAHSACKFLYHVELKNRMWCARKLKK